MVWETIQSQSAACHLGHNKTREHFTKINYRPNINTDLNQYMAFCDGYQCSQENIPSEGQLKASSHPSVELGWHRTTGPMVKVEGCKYVVTVIDYFTRWPQIIPLKSTCAIEVANN